MKYERLEHTADVMIKAFGNSIEECFANAALAMIDTILDASTVEIRKTVTISVEGDNLFDQLYNFLSELLYQFDGEHFVPVEFKISFAENMLICEAKGENYNPAKHQPKTEIKAVTYHGMDINLEEPSIVVLFDV
ncbi:archease [Candidatus Methanomassiliicoccus intestinalis]|uniref:archease n=1 Tax=Candidatus Methanomassiliicoccus intestinalis TaxID=1406512 RepID=UPI0037DD7F84